jgi:hypothetical protein
MVSCPIAALAALAVANGQLPVILACVHRRTQTPVCATLLANRGHSFSVRRIAHYITEEYAKKRPTARFCAIQAGQYRERMPLKQPIIGASPTKIALLRSQ